MTGHESKLAKELMEVFNRSIGKGFSSAAILVSHRNGNTVLNEVGVPYDVSDGMLVMGPYVKDERSPIPTDYQSRKIKIPLADIIGYGWVTLDQFNLRYNIKG